MASSHNNRSAKQKFLHGAVILALGALLSKGIGALFKIPLTRILTTQGAGHFNVAYNIYTVLLNISSTGLPLAVSRLISEASTLGKSRQVRSIHHVSLGLFILMGGICSSIMFFGAQQIANWMRDPDAVYAIRVLAPAVLFVCVCSAFRGYFQGQQYMTPTAVAQVLEALSKLLIGLAALHFAMNAGWALPQAAGASILGVTIGSMLGCLYFFVQYRTRPLNLPIQEDVEPIQPLHKTAAQIIGLAIPITISATGLQIFNALGSKIILGRLQDALGYGLAQASSMYGVYSMAHTLYLLPSALVQPLTVSIIPAVTEALSMGRSSEAKANEESALRIASLIAMPAGIGLSVLSNPIQKMLYAYDMENLSLAGPTLSILGIASIGYCLILVTNAILQVHGKAVLPVWSTIAGGVGNMVVTWILVGQPEIHIYGAAIGTLVYCIVALACNLFFIRKTVPCPPCFLRQTSKTALAAGIMGITAGIVYHFSHNALAAIAAAVCIYAALIAGMKILTWNDCLSLPRGQWIAGILHIKPPTSQEEKE